MAITYDVAINYITVTGYTSGTPGTFTDIYNADKAGTLSLHTRAGIAAVDGAPVAVTYALRPADYVILGGASHDLYIAVTLWTNMTTATIQITGTDRDGTAQTEDIVVTGDATYYTTKWFKTITHTQVTVFTKSDSGTFSYDLIQGQWGVVWKTGNVQFNLNCKLKIGDGTTTTWFGDTEKQVLFSNPSSGTWENFLMFMNHSTSTFGILKDLATKITGYGVQFMVDDVNSYNRVDALAGSVTYFYSSAWQQSHQSAGYYYLQGYITRFWNCFVNNDIAPQLLTGCDFYNYLSHGGFSVMTACTFTNVFLMIFYDLMLTANKTATIRDMFYRTTQTWYTVNMSSVTDDHVYLINVDSNLWVVRWSGVCTKECRRQYTFNLRVVDKEGAGIVGVLVTMVDKNGTAIFSVTTDANGDIVEQIVTYGYWDQANDITMQPVGSYSPHTVTMYKSGYITKSVAYTMDQKRAGVQRLENKREA